MGNSITEFQRNLIANGVLVRRFATLTMFFASFIFAHSSDPKDLLNRAENALGAPDQIKAKKIVSLLRQANDLWAKASSDDPAYAQSLDLLALLLHRELRLDQWRTEAAPLVHRALQIRESYPNTAPDDLALALELQADASDGGREGAGAPFWRRATEIRADNIAAIQRQKGLPEAVPPEKVGVQVSFPRLISKVEAEDLLQTTSD